MRRAVALALRAEGSTSPNPPVGAVVVRAREIVGEGFTQPAGEAHAEIMALREAGPRARGAALYVTLEPCSHWGRTPPCVDAIVEAGVAEVHVAILDPNPSVDGISVLERHGIPVILGECAADAGELIEAHARFITTRRPLVTAVDDAPHAVKDRMIAISDAVLRPVSGAGSGYEAVYRSGERWVLGRDVDWNAALLALGERQVVSCLATGSRLIDAMLREGLVDRMVAWPDATPPTGFIRRRVRSSPAPHLLVYREEI